MKIPTRATIREFLEYVYALEVIAENEGYDKHYTDSASEVIEWLREQSKK
jgi:hypothetical protein